MSMAEENGVYVQSVAFGSESVEVTYIERHRADAPVTHIETLVVPAGLVMDELAEVNDSVQQLIDRALEINRRPPERITRGR